MNTSISTVAYFISPSGKLVKQTITLVQVSEEETMAVSTSAVKVEIS